MNYVRPIRSYATSRLTRNLLLLLLISNPGASIVAQDISSDDARSLDGQVQEIKSDVLNIASELKVLEERLLYSSNTQLSVFVSMGGNESFRRDSVELRVNGELAMHHIYSFKELEALQKGGVQRVYTGNVTTGDHDIGVTMIGKLKNGKDFNASDNFAFAKGVKPKALGITLAEPDSGKSGIQIGNW